jgi:hypothetical protein
MKKVKLSMMVAFMAIGSFMFSACTTDEPGTSNGPSLEFLGGAGYVSTDVTVAGGSTFKVGIVGSHDKKIDKMQIRVKYDGSATQLVPSPCTICDSTVNSSDIKVDFVGTTRAQAGTETWVFTLTDKDGLSTTKEITLTTTKAPKPIRFIDVTLGNQKSTTLGSSLDLTTISAYLLAEAKANSALVDLMYVKSDTDGDILCAPASSAAIAIYPSMSTWTTKNNTKVRKTTLTSGQFDGMTDSKLILQELANNSGASDKLINVSNNDIVLVAPVSATGKNSLVKVVSIDTDNSMTLKVAVEDI